MTDGNGINRPASGQAPASRPSVPSTPGGGTLQGRHPTWPCLIGSVPGTEPDADRRADGLFLFHVNALEDRPPRARWRPARELEKDYVLEQSGQTMHFFSSAYLRQLLREWRELHLCPVEIPHNETGEPFKRVWRGIAHR